MSPAPDSLYAATLKQRTAALDAIFGKQALYMASPVPFYLGGDATVLAYEDYLPNHVVYSTNEMTGAWGSGQKPGPGGEFELVMVLPKGSALAPTRISGGVIKKGWLGVTLHGFARYSTQTTLIPGEVAGPLPDAFSPHTHLLFVDLMKDKAKFKFGGQQYGLLLLMSIYDSERQYHEEHGAAALIARLRQAGVFPATDPTRASAVKGNR